MSTLTVRRSAWSRGATDSGLAVQNLDGAVMHCILGFWAKQLGGMSDDQMMDAAVPPVRVLLRLGIGPVSSATAMQRQVTALAAQLIGVNDDDAMTEDMREAELARIFSPLGVQLQFTE